jgi:hypothetical protein
LRSGRSLLRGLRLSLAPLRAGLLLNRQEREKKRR